MRATLIMGAVAVALVWGCERMDNPGAMAGSDASSRSSHCVGDDPAVARAMVANDAWVQVATDQDPFWADHNEHTPCEEDALRVEEVDGSLWFDVITEGCNHLTVSQPALGCAGEGEDLTIWVFHYAITAGEGSYTMALALGEPAQIVWELEQPVPTEAGLVFEAVPLGHPIEAGDTITWHISNHGTNTWSMIGVFAGAPGALVPGSRAP